MAKDHLNSRSLSVTDATERLYDANRVFRVLADDRFDGLVVSGPENVTYFTKLSVPITYLRREIQLFAVLAAAAADDPALVLPVSSLAFLIDEPWIGSSVYVYGDSSTVLPGVDAHLDTRESRLVELLKTTPRFASALEALVAVLYERHLTEARLAVDDSGISLATWGALQKRLSRGQIEPASDTVRRIRAVKTAPEIAFLRRSAEIIECAQDELFTAIRQGVTEKQLNDVLEKRVAAEGGKLGFSYLGLGARGAALRPALSAPARPMDLIRTEMGCTFFHYWSDTGRTAVLGSSSDKQRRYFDALLKGRQAAVQHPSRGCQGESSIRGCPVSCP